MGHEINYHDLVTSAAEKAGCMEILSITQEFDVDETDEGDVRGTQYIGRSRRALTQNINLEREISGATARYNEYLPEEIPASLIKVPGESADGAPKTNSF
ncbi:hypothetical protein N7520_008416 [Penicillium odoratum]|uniref:uncharacterized protein n=1 Tax=Penicillium odoratum TaxID=1167516 RepID=UPI002548A092|nr:uncharacterized protein N7520_008416 [Penicillium odoratum]KAJ5761260.1 hypothetical protein N7520_008416 [Penicillium odoratum]